MEPDLDRLLHEVSALDTHLGSRLRKHLERAPSRDPFDGLWGRLVVMSVSLDEIYYIDEIQYSSPARKLTMEVEVTSGDEQLLLAWMQRQWGR